MFYAASLVNNVAAQTSVDTSVTTLVDGFIAAVSDLREQTIRAGADTTPVNTLLAQLMANKAALADAVVRNTPVRE